MPTKVKNPVTGETRLRTEAYSTISLFDMRTGEFTKDGFGYIKIRQVFATGRAATQPSAGTAVGNTMLDLKNIKPLGLDTETDAGLKEDLTNLLEEDEFSDLTLKAIIDVMGLNQNAGISEAATRQLADDRR